MHGRGPERHDDRARDYDRRRGPSPMRPSRGMRDERDRGYDRGYQREREGDRYDRGRDRGGLGRDRSPVLKKARYARSRSPGWRSSRSPGRGGVNRPRCVLPPPPPPFSTMSLIVLPLPFTYYAPLPV